MVVAIRLKINLVMTSFGKCRLLRFNLMLILVLIAPCYLVSCSPICFEIIEEAHVTKCGHTFWLVLVQMSELMVCEC